MAGGHRFPVGLRTLEATQSRTLGRVRLVQGGAMRVEWSEASHGPL
jgi:hypothetical protein